MFDLAKAESLKDLPMTQVLVSTAISLVLVIAPLSPSFATELQQEPEIELTKKGSLSNGPMHPELAWRMRSQNTQ